MKTELKRTKFSLWFWTLGLILKVVWEPISLKRSHFWNWSVFDNAKNIINTKTGYVTGREIRSGSRNTRWSMLWQTNFGWQSIVVVYPKNASCYRILFSSKSSDFKRLEICDLLVDGYIGLLIGPDETRFYALDENGRQVPLQMFVKTSKHLFKTKYKRFELI